MGPNQRGHEIAADLWIRADDIAAVRHDRGGVRVLDCGVKAAGGDAAGLGMARVALGGDGEVSLTAAGSGREAWAGCPWPTVGVTTERAVAACLAAQYAGWRVATPVYFAMASGPMRAAIGREALFDKIGMRERPPVAVGPLETAKLPPVEVCQELAAAAGVSAESLMLLVARTASAAGTLQIVARSLETAIHKLHDVGFDLRRILGGEGTAPLPPVAADDLAAIGRTNDAILYGGSATIRVTGDDADLADIGPRAISRASRSGGRSFREIFAAAGGDFYAIDPALFAPARLEFLNVETGRRQAFGAVAQEIVDASFTSGGDVLPR